MRKDFPSNKKKSRRGQSLPRRGHILETIWTPMSRDLEWRTGPDGAKDVHRTIFSLQQCAEWFLQQFRRQG